MLKWISIGTVLQLAMVLVGHWSAAVASLFAPLGVAISLVVGLLWARDGSTAYGNGAGGGALVGGACAFVGVLVSFLLGDVGPAILLIGTGSSAVAGLVGGVLGYRFRSAKAVAT